MDGALFDDEEDEASANIQADRMFTALCRFGWHRAAELPSIARVHPHSSEDAIKLSAHYLCQCAAQVAPVADKWPVVLAASAVVTAGGSKPPKPMQSLRVRERIEKKARHDLLRLHQLHALHAFVLRQPAMAAACAVPGDVGDEGGVGGVGSSSALGGSAREAEARCVQLLLDSESASTAAGWGSSLLGRACAALQPLLDDVKGAPPAPAWGAQHDARLLIGVYVHGWGHYDLLRKHDALWQFATALEEGADADAAAAGGAWGGGAWPETKVLERRVNALFKRVPGAAPPKELGSGGGGGGEGGEGASSRADAKDGSAGGGAKRKRKVEKVQPDDDDDDEEEEDEDEDEEDEDRPYKPMKKGSVKKEPSLKKAAGAKKATGGASGASSSGAGERSERAGAGGAAGGGKAPTREPTREEIASEREAARKDLTELLLAFGLPTSDDDWERVRQHATTASLKKSPAEALRKGGERLAKEWELDAKSKNEETSREAKQRLARLDIVATLRRFIDRNPRPDVGAPSLEKEDPMPAWWQPPTHDAALVHGVLKHGFPKGNEGWKAIYSDLEVFASPAAKASPPSKMASLKRLKRIHLAMTPSKAAAPKTAPKALKQPPAWMLAPPPASAAAQRAAKEAAAAAAAALAAKEAADAGATGVSGGGAAAPAAAAGGSSAGPAAAPTTAPSGPVTVATLSSLSRVGVPLSDALESSRSHKPTPEGAKPTPEGAKPKNKAATAAASTAGVASTPPPAPPPALKPAPKPAASTARPASAWQKPAEPTLPPQPWQKPGAAAAAPAAAPAAARAVAPAAARAAAAQGSDDDDDVPLAARAR